jgi:hypothetical protein
VNLTDSVIGTVTICDRRRMPPASPKVSTERCLRGADMSTSEPPHSARPRVNAVWRGILVALVVWFGLSVEIVLSYVVYASREDNWSPVGAGRLTPSVFMPLDTLMAAAG